MKSNASLIYGLILIIGDSLALVAAFVAAYILRSQFSNVPVAHPLAATTYLGIFLLMLPFWILVFGLMGLYGNEIQEKRFALSAVHSASASLSMRCQPMQCSRGRP